MDLGHCKVPGAHEDTHVQRQPGDHGYGHVVSHVCIEKLRSSAIRCVATEEESARPCVPWGWGLT